MASGDIEKLARERLGFERLRPGQLPAVEALVAGRDVLAVLPTGAGKSAIYELAGLLRAGPTVVVSPLIALEDAAGLSLQGVRAALTTDSYVVSPLFFPGGDIGDLAVNGTVNDLSVAGATPLYLSAGFILEEGFPVADLVRVTASMRDAAALAGVQIVTGDTKVVQRGKADGCYINTAGVGLLSRDVSVGVALASRATRSSCPGRSATTASRSCSPAASWTSRPTSSRTPRR